MGRKALFTFILFSSGLAGISYEVLYGRILGNMLGDQFAVSAAVLITFLLGIGLGSKYAHRLWRYLWLLEAVIGVYGICFALGKELIDHLLYHGLAFVPGLPGSIFLGMLLLLLPALAIGCSVPLFAGYLSRIEAGAVFSRVYAIYNFGAAATALIIEFYLIRRFGITGTLLAFTLVNLLIAALLLVFFKPIAENPPMPETAFQPPPRNQVVSLILISIASAIFQLFMVKMSELMFGPFRESFALVLAIILFGIAVGSFLVRRLNIGYAALLLINIAGIFCFFAFYEYLLFFYAALYETAVANGVAIVLLKGFVLIILMGLPAITFGATVPALLKNHAEIAAESGSLLFISSLANVGGFLLMALLLHQYLDYGVQLLAVAGLALAALASYAGNRYRLPLATAAIITLAAIGLHAWLWDEDLLYLSYTSFHTTEDMRADREKFEFPDKFKGHQDVFSINWIDGAPFFFINGYISIPLNSPSEKIVGAIGSMFSPRVNEGLVLGLGSGGTASAVGMLFDHTDVVEINPVVRDNISRMKQWNFDIEHNPKVNIVVDDAIHYTKSNPKQYDMILNTVTTPLYFSSSKLYTRDFFEVIKTRLTPGGVYVTWMDSRIGSTGAEIVLNTLKQSFGHCSILFIKASYYLLIASDQPVRLHHPDLADRGMPLKMDLMGKHDCIPRNLAYNLMTTRPFDLVKNSEAPINTIDKPALEFEIARLRKKGFGIFKGKVVDTLAFDDVRSGIEPAMPYDPVMHVAHAAMYLKKSNITNRWKQQGRIFVKDFDKRLDEASLSIYRQIAETVNDGNARHRLGFQYMDRERYDEALAEYGKVLLLDPNHRNTLFNIAASHEYKNNYQLAITYYELAEKRDPKDADVPFRLGRVYLKMRQYDAALVAIDRSLAMRRNAKSHTLRAKILEGMGRTREAVDAYQKALDLNADDHDIQLALNRHLARW